MKHFSTLGHHYDERNSKVLDNQMNLYNWESNLWGTLNQWYEKGRFIHPQNKGVGLQFPKNIKNGKTKFKTFFVFNFDETRELEILNQYFIDNK
jgi:hypothetical protein